MSLSPSMIQWVSARVREAEAILASPQSTKSQRAVARLVLSTWRLS